MSPSHLCISPASLPYLSVPISRKLTLPVLGYPSRDLLYKNKQIRRVFSAFSTNGARYMLICISVFPLTTSRWPVSFSTRTPPHTGASWSFPPLPSIKVLKSYQPEFNQTCATYSLGDLGKFIFLFALNLQISKTEILMHCHLTSLLGVGG